MSKKNLFDSIKHWPKDDRPREKLMHKGTAALSNAELLAILLGSGSPQESAVSLSKRMLAAVDHSLSRLGRMQLSDFQKFRGIGEAKGLTLIAALELGRRRRMEKAKQLPKISSSKAAFELFQPILADLTHEEFWVAFLNNANKVLEVKQFSKGGLTAATVDIRLILRKALELHAVGLLFAHNHPSGNIKPSALDKKLTDGFVQAAKIMHIEVLDHLVVTENMYFSFADEGKLL